MQFTVLRYDQKRHTPLVQPSMHESCEISGTLPTGESEKRSCSCRTLKTVGRSCTVSGPELQFSNRLYLEVLAAPLAGSMIYTRPPSVSFLSKKYTLCILLQSQEEGRGKFRVACEQR